MSHGIRADPEKLRRMADVVLDSSKELSTEREYLAEAIAVFARSPGAFGNLAWSDQLRTAVMEDAHETGVALGALAGALTRDVEAVLQTAANYEKLDEGLTEDDFGPVWHHLKEFGKDVKDYWKNYTPW